MRPSASWVWDWDWDWVWVTQGSRLDHPSVTPGSRLGHAWVEWNNWFCLQQELKNAGWGLKNRRDRRHRASSPKSDWDLLGIRPCKPFEILVGQGGGRGAAPTHGNAVGKRINIPERRRRDTAHGPPNKNSGPIWPAFAAKKMGKIAIHCARWEIPKLCCFGQYSRPPSMYYIEHMAAPGQNTQNPRNPRNPQDPRKQKRDPPQWPCPMCNGDGVVSGVLCRMCQGSGKNPLQQAQ